MQASECGSTNVFTRRKKKVWNRITVYPEVSLSFPTRNHQFPLAIYVCAEDNLHFAILSIFRSMYTVQFSTIIPSLISSIMFRMFLSDLTTRQVSIAVDVGSLNVSISLFL